jgi:hypothetical protein
MPCCSTFGINQHREVVQFPSLVVVDLTPSCSLPTPSRSHFELENLAAMPSAGAATWVSSVSSQSLLIRRSSVREATSAGSRIPVLNFDSCAKNALEGSNT